ncbi:MAG: hypothetical protein M5U08_25875 [Burkholderiales bacterium]|nr:hypothetical protein [Burkholderiales bacterium]
MRQAAFEASYFEAWSRFERWLDDRQKPKRAGSRRVEPAAPPGLADAEVPRAYRQLCHHLALARDRAYSPDLVDRLNELALRGHHVLYGARSQRRGQVAQFFLADFPRRVRAEWRLVAIAAAAFLGPVLAIAAALQHHPDFVHYLLAPRASRKSRRCTTPPIRGSACARPTRT